MVFDCPAAFAILETRIDFYVLGEYDSFDQLVRYSAMSVQKAEHSILSSVRVQDKKGNPKCVRAKHAETHTIETSSQSIVRPGSHECLLGSDSKSEARQ